MPRTQASKPSKKALGYIKTCNKKDAQCTFTCELGLHEPVKGCITEHGGGSCSPIHLSRLSLCLNWGLFK